MIKLSIIIPVLNEAGIIRTALDRLAPLRERGVQIIVVDGGSSDHTREQARPAADIVISAPAGRGAQMNAGAAAARGGILLFLHADTRLPADADRLVAAGLTGSGRAWGRFAVRIEGESRLLPLIAHVMNSRSRLTGIATGDQAMFVRREAFGAAGGFPEIPLMEDIVLSRWLKRISRPLCLATAVVTSGRRWDENGAARTILLMWRLRLAYACGAAPEMLARRYGYGVERS
jgi:rSAM/selenodomain-associated transferase 2